MGNGFSYLYEFGPFCLNPAERLLLRNGEPVHIPPKAFDVLVILVQRGGRLVEKRELMEAVWPGLFVEEGNLSVIVHTLRRALCHDQGDQKYIETVSKRGYRFSAEIRLIEAELLPPAESVHMMPVPESPALSGSLIPPQSGNWLKSSLPENWVPLRSKEAPRIRRLHWIWMALVAVVLPLLLLMVKRVFLRQEPTTWPNVRAIHSLAVLPFTIIGEKSGDAYLGLGMADAVTTKLDNTGKIVIRSTSALEKYVGALRNPVAAGREQQVDAVLDGHIQRVGNRVRLTVQLIRVDDGARIWGETFDEKYTDIFSVQDAVSEQVARSIQLELTGAEQKRLTRRPTENSDAYRAYVMGRYFWNKRTTAGLWKGLKYFQQAVALDPAYTEALAGIADSYALLGEYTVLPPRVAFPMAKEAATKALKMDPELADPHATLGFVDLFYNLDGVAAEKEFQRALQSNPNYAIAHTWYGVDLAAMGRHKEAMVEAKRAEAVDPLSLTVSTDVGLIAYLAGRNDEAIDSIKKAIEIDPNFPRAHFRLGNAYLQKGMNQEALAEFKKAVQLSEGGDNYEDQYYDASLGETYAILGNKSEARKMLNCLIERFKRQYVPAYGIALIYAGLGERGQMFEWLKRAYDERSTSMAYLKVDPALSRYRSDPQFAAIAQSVRF
jgi:DNA-binding winged helix-turn-helix (wHTH) protein/TolB-like protein/Flp pilus assembly protein TadD